MSNEQIFRVLSIDGGGMRGYYSAAYLQGLTNIAKNRYDQLDFDISEQFQLIVGTSTGAIVGAGLLAGKNPGQIMSFYRDYGGKIFPKPLPSKLISLVCQRRKKINRSGNDALRNGLTEAFGQMTLYEIYRKRQIAFAVPAVDATTHKAWIFKTPHNHDSNHRDDEFSLVDVCLAASAAPIFRSLASVKRSRQSCTRDMFVDGGLWANNPILIALSEALRLTEQDQQIEIFCLGTSPEITGSVMNHDDPHWGFQEWKFGGEALKMSLDAQAGVFDHLANSFLPHLDRRVTIIRLPQIPPSAPQSKLLGLDCTSKASYDLMSTLASRAVDETNRLMADKTREAEAIKSLLMHS